MTSRKDLSVSERIAALQRGSSPQPQGGRHASPPGTPPTLTPTHSLKDKIAHFDALGTAPKPVGSFGLGALPAPSEHRTVNRELYGNRIPSVNHKTGRSVSSGKELSQFASSSTASLDAHDRANSRAGSNYSAEEGNDATSPTGSAQEPPSAIGHTSAAVPQIRRTDSMTEHWVDNQHSKPTISLDLSGGALAPPSPIPDSEDALIPAGPTTPLTSILVRHLGTSSHVPSRLGNETPVSMMVETGSLTDGEQPDLVPDEDNGPVPSSPVVTGMQALGLSEDHAEGETTPTREDSEIGSLKTPELPSDASVASVAGSLAPPSISGPGDEGPNTPLARSVEVDEPVTAVSLTEGSTESGLNLLTGEQAPTVPGGSELTTSNVRQLNAEVSSLAPSIVGPSGPSSVIVEPGSVARSLQPSPSPQQTGAQTPEPSSALTPKQSLSELPSVGHGSVPLSAASLRLLNIEGGMKGGHGHRSGTETPMSILVEAGSTDGKPRDLEGVDAPIATPAPASPATSYFDEPKAEVVIQPEQPRTDESETAKDTTSHVNIANSEPDNRSTEQGPPVPAKDIPKIVTDTVMSVPTLVETASPTELQTPTNKNLSVGVPFPVGSPTTPLARVPNLHKSRSRPDFSTASTSSAPSLPPPATPSTLAAPNSGLQRRATTGSKPPQRRRVSRIPQMQLLPSGQWGVVDDDDSDEEDTGGWAKVVVSRTRLS